MKYPLVKPKYYVSLLREITHFIKWPNAEENHTKSVKMKVYDTLGLYFLKIIGLIPLVLFFAVVYDPEDVQGVSMLERYSPFTLVLVGGFVLPFVEEIAFRLSLRFRPFYLALSSSVFMYYVLSKLVYSARISAIDESFVLRFTISILFGLTLFATISFTNLKDTLARFWGRHFRVIYYLSCIVFAWIHITKYELNTLNLLLLPILTLPQFMSALINGYTRVAFGFQYPLIFHISNNLVGIGLSFLPMSDLIL